MSHVLRLPRPHAVWTEPLPTEVGAPPWRTVHALQVGLARRSGSVRVGIRPSLGYLHCGSRDEVDQVRDVRVHAWDGRAWRLAADLRDIPAVPDAPVRDGAVTWIEGDWAGALGLRVEIRRSWVDDWWPSWNLAERGVVIEAPEPDRIIDEQDTLLHAAGVDLTGLPDGVTATLEAGAVVYRTPVMHVGFRLRSPTMSRLAFDPDGLTDRTTDLLHHAVLFTHTGTDLVIDSQHPLRGAFANGPRFVAPDGIESLGSQVRHIEGTSRVDGATVRYDVRLRDLDLAWRLTWQVEPEALRLAIERTSASGMRATESASWQLPFDATAAITGGSARPDRRGETGLASGPVLLHAPGHGCMVVEATGDVLIRCDAYRPQLGTTLEVKVGEVPGPLGDWELSPGTASGQVTFRVRHPDIPTLRPDTPAVVRSAIERTAPTGLSFRLDTATLSNNHASIHATFCMDYWAYLALAVGDALPGLSSVRFVTDSMERHLHDGPGYGSGHTSLHPGRVEDEYLHTDVAVVLAAAVVAQRPEGKAWVRAHAGRLGDILDRLAAHDVDGDGLIEGQLRRGRSGLREWATNWWDIISFGWKDAWLNALLYDGLVRLLQDAAEVAESSTTGVAGVRAWMDRLRMAYLPTFRNDDTGWLAGWVSEDGVKHDHGYLFVTGTAVTAGLLDAPTAREMVDRLWDATVAAGFDAFELGLPGNILPIPDADMAVALPDLHHGFYENGAATLSQARHFIGALQAVGRHDDADRLLLAMCERLADGSAFGGCSTGVDWRMWDGTRCGYEGLLTEQLGVLIPALARWGLA